MATLADELENDFAASGSEDEGSPINDSDSQEGVGDESGAADGANLRGPMERDEEEDTEMLDESGNIKEAEEEKAARLKSVKRQQGAGSDMQSVGNFMRSMDPVLEVSTDHITHKTCVYRLLNTDLTDDSDQQKISHYQALPSDQQRQHSSLVEDDPQYKLLTDSNSFSTSIDDQVIEVHKYLRDHYSARFPELETLVQDPLQYAKTVAIIGNGPFDNLRELSSSSDNPVKQPLNAVLTRPQLMTVSVEATATRGQLLPTSEIDAVQDACLIISKLEEARKMLVNYVESRMNLFAPNLTTLIGSRTAAQLLNARGGLTALANTRASNIAAIGSKRPAHSGLATNVGVRNQGYIFDSPLVQGIRSELKTQAMRIISAKIVLAARVDRVHESPDGSTGEELRSQCDKRLDKLTEPAPNKGHKALPAPDDKPSKKRGGRRARKAKEATAMTDLRKAQNRMAFGKEEKEVGYGTGDATQGLGMVGQNNDGRVRSLQVDQRTRAKLSKKNPGWGGGTSSVAGGAASSLRGLGQVGGGAGNASVLKGHGLKTSGLATSLGTGGTASSLAFTPKQGLELVDPKVRLEMERKGRANEDKYFKGGTFTQVSGGGKQDGDFKKPELPAKRKRED
ncbi:MAG: U4/U6-U5 snRNP complex subunit prp31 [Alyxoria varia]|nr:MAG: U4/U6-U5 snRNP complex subunit prp31 [Alyxoria varia]